MKANALERCESFENRRQENGGAFIQKLEYKNGDRNGRCFEEVIIEGVKWKKRRRISTNGWCGLESGRSLINKRWAWDACCACRTAWCWWSRATRRCGGIWKYSLICFPFFYNKWNFISFSITHYSPTSDKSQVAVVMHEWTKVNDGMTTTPPPLKCF